MKIGLLVRADNGGLGAQSLEFAQNLPIHSTLVVSLGDKGRGKARELQWENPFYVTGPHIEDVPTVDAFLEDLDVVISIETFYGSLVLDRARKFHIRTVRYSNPELYKAEGEDRVVVPTDWLLHKMPGATEVIRQGMTLAPDIDDLVRTGPAKTLMHFTAPAMLDRNGSASFHAALAHTKQRFDVKVYGPRTLTRPTGRNHRWWFVDRYIPDRFGHYSESIDLLVLPRRYAGLSLPMLEAASRGIPTLTTNIAPQSQWFSERALVPVLERELVPMVGGRIPVYKADVKALARRLDELALDPITQLSEEAITWAKTHSWELVKPEWMNYLERVV